MFGPPFFESLNLLSCSVSISSASTWVFSDVLRVASLGAGLFFGQVRCGLPDVVLHVALALHHLSRAPANLPRLAAEPNAAALVAWACDSDAHPLLRRGALCVAC